MTEERQAHVVQVTKPDPAMRGGLSTVLYAVLTSGPESAAAIVKLAVGEGVEVEATGTTLSRELSGILNLVPDQARFM